MNNIDGKDRAEKSSTGTMFDHNSELVESALKCTGGDIVKARAMVDGTYVDGSVLKGTFLLQDMGYSGVFVIFFNTEENYIPFMDMITKKSSIIYEQLDMSAGWKNVLREMNTLKSETDDVDISSRKDKIIREIIEMDYFSDVKSGNVDNLEASTELILRKVLGNQNISCKLDLEPVSSLSMMQESVPFEKPSIDYISDKIRSEVENNPELVEKIAEIEKKADYVIDAAIILSPVKGKALYEIENGEKIMVNLDVHDEVAKNVLSSLKALDEDGDFHAIPAKVVGKFVLPVSGSIIMYALVAKGVLVKIIEESNVKISVLNMGEQDKKRFLDNFNLPLPLVLFVIVFFAFILFFLFK